MQVLQHVIQVPHIYHIKGLVLDPFAAGGQACTLRVPVVLHKFLGCLLYLFFASLFFLLPGKYVSFPVIAFRIRDNITIPVHHKCNIGFCAALFIYITQCFFIHTQ